MFGISFFLVFFLDRRVFVRLGSRAEGKVKGGSRPSAANETAPWKYVVGADGSSIARRATPLRRPSSSSSSKKKTTTSTTTGRNNRRPLMRRRSTSLTTEQAPRPGLGFPLALDPPRIERRPKTNKKKQMNDAALSLALSTADAFQTWTWTRRMATISFDGGRCLVERTRLERRTPFRRSHWPVSSATSVGWQRSKWRYVYLSSPNLS